MLGVQTTRGGEALTDHADRERSAAHHAAGGIAERVDALGVKVVLQHAAHAPPSLVEGYPLLPDDHRNPPTRRCQRADSPVGVVSGIASAISQKCVIGGDRRILFGIASTATRFFYAL